MRQKTDKNDVLENVNAWLLKITVGFAVLYFMLIFRSQAFPFELSLKDRIPFYGEISLKGIGLDKTKDRVFRWKEFQVYPDSGISISSILQKEGKNFRVHFTGKELGENDVSALLSLDVGKLTVTDTTYVKVPHVTSLTDFTLRSTNTFSARLLPLSFVSVPVVIKEEDKVGRYTSDNPVGFMAIGQKEKYWSAGVDAAWKFANVSVEYKSSQLKQLQFGSDLKSTAVLLQNAQEQKDMYCGLSYTSTDLTSASNIAGVNDVNVRKWKFETSRNITDALNVEGYYSSNKTTNKNANSISTDAKSYSLSAAYRIEGGDVSAGYTNDTKDYTNAGIAKENIKAWTFSGKKKFAFASIKANYEKKDKDVSGITAARLVNFNELASSSKSWGVSVSSKPVVRRGQIGATYYLKRSVTEPKLVSAYGINSFRTNLNGVTITYLLSDKVTLMYNWALTEWRKSGLFKYHATPDVDASFAVFDNNEFHQGAVDFALSDKTSLSAGYWESNSQGYDSVWLDTKSREQEISLSGQHAFKDDLSLSVLLKRNIYKDAFNVISEGQTNFVEVELTKKF